jgi:hypothetical protein
LKFGPFFPIVAPDRLGQFLAKATRSIDPGFTSTLLNRNTFPYHRGAPQGPIRLISDIALGGSTVYFSFCHGGFDGANDHCCGWDNC